jgi:hypothetical protein
MSLPTAVTASVGMPYRVPMSTIFVILMMEFFLYSPPIKACTAMAHTLSRIDWNIEIIGFFVNDE